MKPEVQKAKSFSKSGWTCNWEMSSKKNISLKTIFFFLTLSSSQTEFPESLQVFYSVQVKIWNVGHFQVQFCAQKKCLNWMLTQLQWLLSPPLSLATVPWYLSNTVCEVIMEVCILFFWRTVKLNISHFKSASAIVCTSFIPFWLDWILTLIFKIHIFYSDRKIVSGHLWSKIIDLSGHFFK